MDLWEVEQRVNAEAEIRHLSKGFHALRSVLRLRILAALSKGESNVRALESELRISQPLLSWHLTQLRQAGFVEAERAGREVRYRIVPSSIRELVDGMVTLLGLTITE
jgi:DNA-binding transcriptional ArsR family regulator